VVDKISVLMIMDVSHYW